ncbi:MAG TPA: alpha/beta family hydrolase [Candidatus Krumholzibacteria bacterium]|nr:alpha/beta family hydrolase [Candidatus Krumholzibacteria bacterium]
MTVAPHELTIDVTDEHRVSGLLIRPRDAWALYVLAHGAGAGMRHAFLETVSRELAGAGVATLRFQFPYTEEERHRPDTPALLEATVRAAVARAVEEELPIFAGGKSMGGRMTTQAQASEPLEGVRGLVLLGFPLHPPGRPGVTRSKHLDAVTIPMLFIQGTRDELANMELMHEVSSSLGSRASLHVIDGGDHSFKVLKRSGRDETAVMQEIRDTMTRFMNNLIPKETPP